METGPQAVSKDLEEWERTRKWVKPLLTWSRASAWLGFGVATLLCVLRLGAEWFALALGLLVLARVMDYALHAQQDFVTSIGGIWSEPKPLRPPRQRTPRVPRMRGSPRSTRGPNRFVRFFLARPHMLPCLVGAGLAAAALLETVPYAYYEVAHVGITASALAALWSAVRVRSVFWGWLSIAVALLFNPIDPADLHRAVWYWADIGAAVILGVAALFVRVPPGKQESGSLDAADLDNP